MIGEFALVAAMMGGAILIAVDGAWLGSYIAANNNRPEGTPSIFSRPAPEYRKPGDEYSGHPEGQEDSQLLDQTYDESTSQDYT